MSAFIRKLLVPMFLVAPSVAGANTSYSYDALGLLQSASVSGGVNSDVSVQTRFDAAGNRTSNNVVGRGAAAMSSTVATSGDTVVGSADHGGNSRAVATPDGSPGTL